MKNKLFYVFMFLLMTTLMAQDFIVDDIVKINNNRIGLSKSKSTQKITSNAITINYDNSLLIPIKQNNSPSLWDINKTVTNSYFNKDLFGNETEIDLDIYWWDQTSSNKTVFALDPTWEIIIYADNVSNQIKSYGDHSGDYKFSIPQGITTDGDGYVYVADAGNGKIVKLQYNTSSKSLSLVTTFSISGMTMPTDIRYCEFTAIEGRDPILWVFDRESGTLFALTLTGQVYYQMTQYKYNNQYYSFEGIDRVVTPDIYAHNIYLFDNNNKRVIKGSIPSRVTNPNYITASFVQTLPRNSYITDVGTDCFGDIYLTDLFNDCLHKFSESSGEYLGSYNNSSTINNPQRVSASNLKQIGRLSLDFFVSNAWSSNYGIRRFLTGCELNNLTYVKSGNDYDIKYLLTSDAELFIEVYRNNSLIKNQELLLGYRSSGSNEYTLTGSELGSGTIKVKMKYRPYFDEDYGSNQQGWQYKEITFAVSSPLAVSISGPTSLSSGQSGTFTASVSGGTTPYTYQWYWQYPSGGVAKINGSLHKPPAGYWFSLGSNSSTLTKSDDEDFQIKCVVSDNASSVVTSNIRTVYISGGASPKVLASDDGRETKLYKNYPNPFNPTTIIKYSLREKSMVELRVYDSIGREIVELVNQVQAEGEYNVRFNANSLSSGIYIYQLRANNEIFTNKMILTK